MKYDHLGMLPERAFKPIGKRMTLEGGGGGGGEQKSYSTNLPEYAKPYYEELLKQTGKQTFDTDAEGNVTGVKGPGNLPQQTVAGFTPYQQQTQQNIANLGTPGQFAQSTQGLGAGQQLGYGTAMAGLNQAFGYQPSSYQAEQVRAPNLYNYQMADVANVNAPRLRNYGMNAAQTGFNPNLQSYQMAGPRNVGAQMFGQGAADYYSNPFQQNVTNIALRQAQQKGLMDKNALMSGAISRGTFGGARNALLQAEQANNLNEQLSDIQYRGSSDAYTNAQQQFQADQQRRMQADLANQQAGLTTGQQNLQAMLQTQGLGANIGKDIALANLSNAQQANVQNLAAQLQTQGLSADQAMRAALANQQARLTTGQQNLQALLGVQSLGAGQNLQAQQLNQQAGLTANQQNQQAQQYAAGLGKDLGLAGLQTGVDTSKALGALGTEQQQADLARLQAQQGVGSAQQQQAQREADIDYQNQMARENFQRQQLQYYSDILRGNAGALGSTQVNYTPAPSAISQIGGLGLGALGLAKAYG